MCGFTAVVHMSKCYNVCASGTGESGSSGTELKRSKRHLGTVRKLWKREVDALEECLVGIVDPTAYCVVGKVSP